MAQQVLTPKGDNGARSNRVLDRLTPANATGAPAVNAEFKGQIYIDETAETPAVYISVKVGSPTPADDWKKMAFAV